MTRFDLMSPRAGKDGKTRWFKLGAAFPREKGGYQLVFDALPLPDAEGRVTLMMWEAQERDDQRGGQSSQARTADRAQRPARDDLDTDSIPF